MRRSFNDLDETVLADKISEENHGANHDQRKPSTTIKENGIDNMGFKIDDIC